MVRTRLVGRDPDQDEADHAARAEEALPADGQGEGRVLPEERREVLAAPGACEGLAVDVGERVGLAHRRLVQDDLRREWKRNAIIAA